MSKSFTSKVPRGNCMRCKTTLQPGQSILAVKTTAAINTRGYIHANRKDCNTNNKQETN